MSGMDIDVEEDEWVDLLILEGYELFISEFLLFID